MSVLLSSCSFNMGKVPIIVKELEGDELDYADLQRRRLQAYQKSQEKKDCIHLLLFVPSKLSLDMKDVLSRSCKNSNFSFENKFEDRFFYFLYGQECFVNEHNCEDT